MKNINELRRKRGVIIETMRALTNKAEAENRDLNAEELERWNKAEADQENLRLEVEREERQVSLEIEQRQIPNPTPLPVPAPAASAPGDIRATPEYTKRFNSYLLGGDRAVSPDERRALQMDSPAGGGFTVAPQLFVAQLIQAMDNAVFVRQMATKFSVAKAESMGAPSLDADPADSNWTAELLTGSEDSTMAFGKRELYPHPLAKLLKVSNKLLRASAVPVDGIVRERLGYKFAVTLEAAYMSGSGSNQPLGLFIASDNGIGTARDVSTANSATAITPDNLINVKYSLKGQYQKTAVWLFHRDAVKMIRKLKDGDGQYMWRPGLQADQGDSILDRPFYMSEYVPNTFTTGLYVGLFGDLSFYWIADALDLSIQVLDQLYAITNQTGYIGRLETDGAPVLAEAFARVKLG